MSARTYVFTSESVTEGHPDKVADQISDCRARRRARRGSARAASPARPSSPRGSSIVAGEITTKTYVDVPRLVRDRIARDRLHAPRARFRRRDLRRASPRSRSSRPTSPAASTTLEDYDKATRCDRTGAGDQGMMFGYACHETAAADAAADHARAPHLPRGWPKCARPATLDYLRPDGKALVTVRYEVTSTAAHAPWRSIASSSQPARRRRGRPDADQAGHHRARAPPVLPPSSTTSTACEDGVRARQPDRQVRGRRSAGRHRAHRPQDHRRHLRRRGAPRRRRLLGQGSDEGRPLGRVRGALRGEEHRRRGPRRPLRARRWRTRSASRIPSP